MHFYYYLAQTVSDLLDIFQIYPGLTLFFLSLAKLIGRLYEQANGSHFSHSLENNVFPSKLIEFKEKKGGYKGPSGKKYMTLQISLVFYSIFFPASLEKKKLQKTNTNKIK